jgi:hypothetical protein
VLSPQYEVRKGNQKEFATPCLLPLPSNGEARLRVSSNGRLYPMTLIRYVVVDENGCRQPRRRKSLHDLIGSVGKRYSVRGKRRALGDIAQQTIEESTGEDHHYSGDVGPTSADNQPAQTSRLPMQGPGNDIKQNGKEASEQPSMVEGPTTSNSGTFLPSKSHPLAEC